MENARYALCQNCSTVHYIVGKDEVIKLENETKDIFSKRNLKYCFGCGKNNRFIEISEQEIDSYLSGSEIPAIFLENATVSNQNQNKP